MGKSGGEIYVFILSISIVRNGLWASTLSLSLAALHTTSGRKEPAAIGRFSVSVLLENWSRSCAVGRLGDVTRLWSFDRFPVRAAVGVRIFNTATGKRDFVWPHLKLDNCDNTSHFLIRK